MLSSWFQARMPRTTFTFEYPRSPAAEPCDTERYIPIATLVSRHGTSRPKVDVLAKNSGYPAEAFVGYCHQDLDSAAYRRLTSNLDRQGAR